MRRHHKGREDVVLHDFDAEERVLRILFVSGEGLLLGVTYHLCPRCGVTMQETTLGSSDVVCPVCGLTKEISEGDDP